MYKVIYSSLPSVPPQISAALIVKNCAKRIIPCLECLNELVDEIIVVDDYSTDGSVELILESSSKVSIIVQNKLDCFSKQRNLSLQFCHSDYVVIIDDDEVLSPQLITSIRKTVSRREMGIFNCVRVNHNFHGQALEVLRRPVLMSNKYSFVGSIHEHIPGNLTLIPGRLHHFSDSSIESFLSDIVEYSRLKALSWIKEGRVYSAPYIAARQLLVALYLFFSRYIMQYRFLDGWKALIYCVCWASEEFMVALWYLEARDQ